MKRFIALLAAITVLLCGAAPALAIGFGISPAEITFEVPAAASKSVEFTVYDLNGNLQISLENIPLKVEPATVPVNATATGSKISLTFYGDASLGSRIYQGKIRFLALTGGMVATGIKVRANVTNLVLGETPVLATPEESQPASSTPTQSEAAAPSPASEQSAPGNQGVTILPATEAAEKPTPPTPPSPKGGSSELPILPIVGIAAGAVIVITLIIVLIRRPRY